MGEKKNPMCRILNKLCRKSVSCLVVPDSKILWTVAHQAPLSVEFSRQEYWSRLPFPSPLDIPDPGFEPMSAALKADSLPSEPPGKPEQVPWLSGVNTECAEDPQLIKCTLLPYHCGKLLNICSFFSFSQTLQRTKAWKTTMEDMVGI